MAPPTTASMKTWPVPRGSGFTSIWMSANWPWPPDWRLKRECCAAPRLIDLLVRHLRPARERAEVVSDASAGRARSADGCRPGPRAPSLAARHCARATSVGSSSISRCSAPRQLHVVVALLGGDGEAVDRRRQRELRAGRRRRAARQAPCRWRCLRSAPAPRPRPARPHCSLGRLRAQEPQHAGDAHAVEAHAFASPARSTRAPARACRHCGG